MVCLHATKKVVLCERAFYRGYIGLLLRSLRRFHVFFELHQAPLPSNRHKLRRLMVDYRAIIVVGQYSLFRNANR